MGSVYEFEISVNDGGPGLLARGIRARADLSSLGEHVDDGIAAKGGLELRAPSARHGVTLTPS